MDPKTFNALAKSSQPKWVQGLTGKLREYIRTSRNRMKDYYDHWKDIDDLFQTKAPETNDDDRLAEEREEPTRLTLPFLHSQMHTFIAVSESLLGDRKTLFELVGSGAEDVLPSLLAQNLLERDLEYWNFRHVGLKQFLTNAARYDVAPLKWSWKVEHEQVEIEEPLPGAELSGLFHLMEEDRISYMGNQVWSLSPFRFLPDPRVPIWKLQDGEFCGDDMFYGMDELQEMEGRKEVAGIKHVPNATKDLFQDVQSPFDFDHMEPTNLKNKVLVTEIQFRAIPANLVKDDPTMNGHDLGEEKVRVLFIAWLANDRLVKLERANYPQEKFTYACGVMNPDEENFIGLSMSNILVPIQETADWFINSRVESVRSNVDRQVYADPSAVDINDIAQRKKVVRIRKSFQGTDIRRYIFEPQVSDSTQGNVQDTQILYQFAKEGTGLTDNIIGQFASGRRSAQEAGNVHANALQRVKSDVRTLFHTGLKVMGQCMLANHRQGLDVEQMIRIVGVSDYQQEMQGVIQQFKVSKEHISGQFDFKFQDALLPSEAIGVASTLQELVLQMFQNPEIFKLVMSLGYNPGKMIEELLRLKGLSNVARFKLTQAELNRVATLSGVAGLQIPNGGAPGQAGSNITPFAPVTPGTAGGGTSLGTGQSFGF